MQHRHILVAIDLREKAQPALKRAIELAKRENASYSILYVAPYIPQNLPYVEYDDQLKVEAKQALEALVEKLDLKPKKLEARIGSICDEIINFAADIKADLIILGSHGKHGLDLLLGSTANGVVHQAACDVLTVRMNQKDQAVVPHPYRKAVVAVDFRKDNDAVLKNIQDLVQDVKTEAYVINVIPDISPMLPTHFSDIELDLREEGREHMRDLCQSLGIPDNHSRVEIGDPASEIVAYAKEIHADVIVVGNHARQILSTLLLGSTAHGVLHAAEVDVWLVKI